MENIKIDAVFGMWGFKPEWRLKTEDVGPESHPMKMGGGNVGHNEAHKLHKSYS
ncbi:hypothetical protein [Thermococcus sp.]